jgi:hypothetical protein
VDTYKFVKTPVLITTKATPKEGMKYGRLTYLFHGKCGKGAVYVYKCDCGNIHRQTVESVHRDGVNKTCGCGINKTELYYYKFRQGFKKQFDKAGVLYWNTDQFKKDIIPYWCPIHNEYSLVSKASFRKFSVAPCFKCGKEVASSKRVKTTEDFINDSKTLWGEDRWLYYNTTYKGCHGKLTITCPEHGDFLQSATEHLTGNNACKGCQPHSGYIKDRGGWFYLVRWENSKGSIFIKFGVTNNEVSWRINKQATRHANIDYKPEILSSFFYEDGTHPIILEKLIKSTFITGIVDKQDFPDGFSETTSIENLEIINKIIYDYNKKLGEILCH